MTYPIPNGRNLKRYALQAAVISGLTMLAACGGPTPQTVSTTSQETTTAPTPPTMAPPSLVPGAPGTTTTTTTNSQTQSPSQ